MGQKRFCLFLLLIHLETLNSSWEEEIDYSSQQNYEDDDESEPYKTSRIEFGTGMSFFLTNNISLEPSVNFALNKYTQEQEILYWF